MSAKPCEHEWAVVSFVFASWLECGLCGERSDIPMMPAPVAAYAEGGPVSVPINYWDNAWHWSERTFYNTITKPLPGGLVAEEWLTTLHCDRCGFRLGQHMADPRNRRCPIPSPFTAPGVSR